MDEMKTKFYKLLNKYNELEYGISTRSKNRSFLAFLLLFSVSLIMNITFLVFSIIDNNFILLEIGLLAFLIALIPLIDYIFLNRKSNKILRELIDIKEENKEIFDDCKLLVEDNFKNLIEQGFNFTKENLKHKKILLYKKGDKDFKVVQKRIFGINYLKSYLNDVPVKKLCKNDSKFKVCIESIGYSDSLIMINMFVREYLI